MRFIDHRRSVVAVLVASLCMGAAVKALPAKGPPHAGRLVEIHDFVWINGKLAHGTRDVFTKSHVKTLKSGQARLEMKPFKSTCATAADVSLVLAPRPHVVLQLLSGDLVCTKIAGHTCSDAFRAGPATISSCDPTFAMSVGRHAIVVKVVRGFVVVSGRSGSRAAVIASRNQEVVVPPGHDPQAPIPAIVNQRERKAFTAIPGALPVEHDHTAPTATITNTPLQASSSASATFSFRSGEADVTFACSLDKGPFNVCASPTSYRGLVSGAHVFAVTATDPAGNTARVGSYTWNVDTRPPVTRITSLQPAVTSATSAEFTFVADEAQITFSCQLDGSALAPCSSPASYAGLSSGTHSFTVRATDEAGNVGAPATTVVWTVDARVPVVTISSNQPAITNATAVTLSFSADKSPVSFACQLDASAIAPCVTPTTYSGLTDGTHTFLVRATDALGNAGTTKFAWTIDTIKPIARIASGPPNPEWTSTGTASASFTFTAGENNVVFSCRVDRSAATRCVSPTSYVLTPGTHTFFVTPTDAAGNVGSAASYTWAIDVIPG
jgi:hypothetical protein